MGFIKKILALWIFVFLANSLVKCTPQEEDFVFVLNGKNFDQFVNNNDITVVFFYAPWCGHCTQMKPFYHEAAKILREDENVKTDKPVVFAKIDADAEREISERFSIQGYPTLKIIRKGVSYEYDGPRRDGMAIAKYLQKEASNKWKPTESKVVILTNGNFTEWVNSQELALVEFYSPQCGHCKRLEPNYEKAAQQLSDDPNPIQLAKVDASVEIDLGQKYEIRGFPTLFIFRKGRHYEYKGGRETHEIISHMQKTRESSSKEIDSFKKFNVNVKSPSTTYILGLFANKNDELFKLHDFFSSKYNEDFEIYHSFQTEDFLKHLKSDKLQTPSILVYYHDLAVPKKEPKFRIFNQENAQLKDLEDFVLKDSLPLVNFLSSKNKALIYENIRPICYIFYDVDQELKSHIIYIRDKIVTAARKYPDISFVLVNETEHEDLIKMFHLQDSTEETNVVCLNSKSRIFINKEDDIINNEDDLLEFFKNFKNGKLKPFIKSEIPPKDNSKKSLKTIVGSTIESVVSIPKKEIFIAFVGQNRFRDIHKFETNINNLASKFSKTKNVYFGKIDINKNDFPDMFDKVSKEFPSLYYIPSNDKKNPIALDIIDYEDLSYETFLNFVEDNLQKTEKKILNGANEKKDEL